VQPALKALLVLLGTSLLTWSADAWPASKPRRSASQESPAAFARLGFVDVTPDQLRARVRRVALLPPRLPEWLGDRPDARSTIEDEVSRFFSAAGFELIESAAYQAEYDRLNREAGGIYDVVTGELREDRARAVHESALREVVSKRSADGHVLIEVIDRSAEFFRKRATWDLVTDSTNHSGEGSLPALSLQVRMVDAAGATLFMRRGGIQLTSYSVPERGPVLPRVRPADLLRDPARIRRAAHLITQPLWTGMRADLDAVDPAAKLPPPPQQYKETSEPFKVSRDRILGSVKRLAIAPLGDAEGKLPLESINPVVAMVRTELAPLGWEVVEWPNARDELRARMRLSRPFDPLTGRVDEARITEARKATLRALGAERVDAVLWLSVVRTTAIQRYGVAQWDNVEQRVTFDGPILKQLTVEALDSTGILTMPASSLHVSLTDANDAPLFESRGGLQLMQILHVTPLMGGPPRIEPTDFAPVAMFGYDRGQAIAAHAALRDLTMTPEALAAELARIEEGRSARRHRYLTLEF
jgi:hypothetical protein